MACFVFSCEDAALQVLMSSVRLSVIKLKFFPFPLCNLYRMFQNVPECSRMFQKVPECCGIFQKVPEGSRRFQKVPVDE